MKPSCNALSVEWDCSQTVVWVVHSGHIPQIWRGVETGKPMTCQWALEDVNTVSQIRFQTITRHVHTAKTATDFDLAWFSYLFCRWFWVKHLWNDLNEVLSSHLASRSISRRSQFKGICCNKGLRQWESAPLGALWDGRWTTCLSQSSLSAEPAPVAQFLT